MTEHISHAAYADVDRYLREARRTAGAMRAASERIAGLTGRAEAAAGRVRVTWAAGTGSTSFASTRGRCG